MIFQVHEKHGRHIAYSKDEADRNEKNGWRTVPRSEFYGETVTAADVDALAERYKAKFGKAPHHKMKPETIEAAIHAETV